MNSGDSNLVHQYQQWSNLKDILVILFKLSEAERKDKKINIDSIENIANDLEKEISLKSEVFK
jgi:hypothetical protein